MSNRPRNRPGHSPPLHPGGNDPAWFLGRYRPARYRADARHHEEARARELAGYPLLGGIPHDYWFDPDRRAVARRAIEAARLRREFGPAAGRVPPMVIYDEPGGISRLEPAPGGRTAELTEKENRMPDTVTEAAEVARRDHGDVAPENRHLELALQDGQTFWTEKQQAALTAMGIKNATQADLAVYFHVCQTTRLDPFLRQIYLIERREKVDGKWIPKQTIQIGIDGFRIQRDRAAARTGFVADYEDTIWYDDDGREHTVWLSEDAPAACKVVLVKHRISDGATFRFPAVLRTKAYMPVGDYGPQGQWKPQADHMIEKCCEAFACRRGFPEDLGGLYIMEEMQGGEFADAITPHQPRGREPQTITGAAERAAVPPKAASLHTLGRLFTDAGLAAETYAGARLAVAGVVANVKGEPLQLASLNQLTNYQAMQAAEGLADLMTKLAGNVPGDAASVGDHVRDSLLHIARGAGWEPDGG